MDVSAAFKQTEVGVIPQDWEVAPLDTVAKRGSGHTPDKAHAEYWAGEIKWISLQDTQRLDKLYIFDTAAKITPAGIANSSAKIHPSGTVVVSRDAGVGKSAIMQGDMAVSQHFMAWTCGPSLNNHFLYYWLQSNKAEFQRIAMGSTIKTIGLPYFRQLRISLPTKAEQEAIAEALSDADALTESLEQLLVKKRHLKQGAMQELLTGKKRLPGFSGTWEKTTFGNVVRHHSGNSTLIKGKLLPTPMTGLYAAYSASGQDVWCEHYEHEGEAVVVSAVGSRCGKAFYASGKWCAIANTHVVWPITAKVDMRFLGFYINDEDFWLKSGSGQPFVLFKQTFARSLLLPRIEEQASIATVLSDMDTDLATLETKLTKARHLKQGMMQELLTGRIRLL